MKEKCLKSDVFVNENIFCDSLEQAIDADFTLPDFCPDVSKIFKCNAIPRIVSKSLNGASVTLDGNVTVTILYCDKESRFCSYEYIYPFSKTVELSRDASGGNVTAKVKCDYINCRAVTGRKIDIHGAVGINLRVFKRKCDEIISDIDDELIEVKRMKFPFSQFGDLGGNPQKYEKKNSPRHSTNGICRKIFAHRGRYSPNYRTNVY